MSCDGIQSVTTSLNTLRELGELHNKILADCERLEREMGEFQSNISSEVGRVLSRTQFSIRQPNKPVTVDALSPAAEEILLPPPLLPENLQARYIQAALP